MKKTLTIYLFSLLILFIMGCEDSVSSIDSFFKDIKTNKITSVKVAQDLINQGADINYKDKYDNTFLHVVGNVELAEFFLEKGLDIEARNNEGETPLYTTIKRRHYNVALFLKKKRANGLATINAGIEHPRNIAAKHFIAGGLSSEEEKILKEILRLIDKDNTIRN